MGDRTRIGYLGGTGAGGFPGVKTYDPALDGEPSLSRPSALGPRVWII